MKIFDDLYRNNDGLQDKFVAFWNHTSATFAGNPYVVGFDPINEPFPGNYLKDPRQLKPGFFDKHELQPMYARIHEVYQKNDPESITWFEPSTFPDVNSAPLDVIFPVGFTVPPGG